MLAPAKLNLALHVTGQRGDGYHLLHSLVAFANVGDEVSVSPADADGLSVDGPFAAGVPPLIQNSLGDALALVRRWGLATDPVHVRLTKNLPIASGIGGGSADAAALIKLLAGAMLSEKQMKDCLTLGADVPMCLTGKAAIVSGIGEENTPVALPPAHLVLVNPGVEVSTPRVFGALASKDNPPLPLLPARMTFAALVGYLHTTRNDLMAAAMSLAPQIKLCLEALSDAPFARMSGSGATCFALVETAEAAEALAAKTKKAHPDWWVVNGGLYQ